MGRDLGEDGCRPKGVVRPCLSVDLLVTSSSSAGVWKSSKFVHPAEEVLYVCDGYNGRRVCRRTFTLTGG